MYINVYDHRQCIAETIAHKLVMLSHSKQEEVHIALSGGTTPKTVFGLLKALDKAYEIHWNKLHFWWGDERCVTADDPESNYGEAKRILFDNIEINPENLHPIDGDITPEQATLKFVQSMKKSLPCFQQLPQFDWVLLGMGDDGHTASLFINDPAVESTHWATFVYHPKTKQPRVTLTLPVINNAKQIDFLVTGSAKAEMVDTVLINHKPHITYPAQRVAPTEGSLVWHLDMEAAEKYLVSVAEEADER